MKIFIILVCICLLFSCVEPITKKIIEPTKKHTDQKEIIRRTKEIKIIEQIEPVKTIKRSLPKTPPKIIAPLERISSILLPAKSNYESANQYFETGNYQTALLKYNKAVDSLDIIIKNKDQKPLRPQAYTLKAPIHYKRGQTHVRLNDDTSAKKDFLEVTIISNDNMIIGSAYHAIEKYEEAIEKFKEAFVDVFADDEERANALRLRLLISPPIDKPLKTIVNDLTKKALGFATESRNRKRISELKENLYIFLGIAEEAKKLTSE